MPQPNLSAADQQFLEYLDHVAYGNPFTRERAQLVRQLVPDALPEEVTPDREAIARVVEPRVRQWRDPRRLKGLPAAHQRLLRSAFLYLCYHHHIGSIDDLIARTLAGGESAPADHIGRSICAELVECGISEETSHRYFAFFFQLRRAFHFILRALPGECPSMRALRRALWDSAFTHDMRIYQDGLWSRLEDFSTLLLGETGTGKGQAAAAIGRSQFIPYLPERRRFAVNFTESFVATNLTQFPETLIESELFGHRKGAFTGAISDHTGVFGRCSEHGALFLDEIGEASVPIQLKLLRVLQERNFIPVGGHEPRRFAGRVIAATNRPLSSLRAPGGLREDFYYRLCSDVIEVPTLRQRITERPEELDDLARVLLTRIAGDVSQAIQMRVIDTLRSGVPATYPWPGNVRELEQAIRRILITGSYIPVVGAARSAAREDDLEARFSACTLTADQLLDDYCALLYRKLGSYVEVATRTGLDRRTVRRRIASRRASR